MKKILLTITIGLFAVSAFAQKQQNRHEFSLWGAGGISTLQYDLNTGESKIGYGGMAGLGYTYFFNYHWGLGTGAEFSILNGKLEYPLISDRYWAVNQTSSVAFMYEVDGQNYEESQQLFYINIPLMAKYQTDIAKNKKFYAAIGPKIGIPVKATGTAKGNLSTKGQNPSTLDPYTNMPQHGFFNNYPVDKETDLELELNFIASLEAGVKWQFNNKCSLYTGLFCDYGLNDIRKGNDQELALNFFEYNKNQTSVPVSNSVLFSHYTPDKGQNEAFVDRLSTLSAGLKLQLTFGIKPFNKKEVVPVIPVEKPYEGLTADQLRDIMGENTGEILEAQRKNLEELKKLIMKEDPDLTGSITGFDLDKSDLLPEMLPEIDRKVDIMKKYPNAKIMLVGHTDYTASNAYNNNLGMERALSVKAYMVSKGIDKNRIYISTKGKTEPMLPNDTENNRRLNRRVEFFLP